MESDCRHCARVIEWQVALIKSMRNSIMFRAVNRCDHKPVKAENRQVHQRLDMCFEFSGGAGRCRSDRVRYQFMQLILECIHFDYRRRTLCARHHILTSGFLNATTLWTLVTNTACSDVVDATFKIFSELYVTYPPRYADDQQQIVSLEKGKSDLCRLFIGLFPHMLMTSSSAAAGAIYMVFRLSPRCLRERPMGNHVNVVPYLPVALASNISKNTIASTLSSVEFDFLKMMTSADKFMTITGDRWDLVSGLIRVLTLWNSSHVCDRIVRRDDVARGVSDDIKENFGDDSADVAGTCSHCSDGKGINEFRGVQLIDYWYYKDLYDKFETFKRLCWLHLDIVQYIDDFLKDGASYSHFAAVLQLYDSELGQAVHTPCICQPTVGEQICEIHVKVRKIMARYSSN